LGRLSKLVLIGVLSVMLCSCNSNKSATTQAPEKQTPAAQAPTVNPAQIETNAKVVPFSEMFTANPDGSVSPKVQVEINGVTLAPGSVCKKGTLYGGLDIAAMNGKKMLTAHKGNLIVIKGAME
jgi:hypothetical protein